MSLQIITTTLAHKIWCGPSYGGGILYNAAIHPSVCTCGPISPDGVVETSKFGGNIPQFKLWHHHFGAEMSNAEVTVEPIEISNLRCSIFLTKCRHTGILFFCGGHLCHRSYYYAENGQWKWYFLRKILIGFSHCGTCLFDNLQSLPSCYPSYGFLLLIFNSSMNVVIVDNLRLILL